MYIGYVGTGYKAKGCIISIDTVEAEGGEVVCSVRPRLYKAGEAKRFRGETEKVIKEMGRNDIRELRYKGRRRWGCIPDIRCGVSSI
jgi:hypothetical protein